MRCFLSWATASLIACAMTAPSLPAQRPRAPRDSGTVLVTARLVVTDLQIRPVALQRFMVLVRHDSGGALAETPVTELRTDLDGRAVTRLSAGRYLIRTADTVTVATTRYRWDLPITVAGGDTVRVELTNLNADSTPVEAFVFETARRAVLRLHAGLRYGTAFVVDCGAGLLVTNDHVLSSTTEPTIRLDATRRVPAQVVVRDADADLAVLRVHPEALAECVALPVGPAGQGGTSPKQGDDIIAIGFPMSQDAPTLTTGIVSGVLDGAVISDVSINPGSSGGPLMDAHGRVIGVATFVEREGAGAGMSGGVTIDKLLPLLDSAAARAGQASPPELRYLPMPPTTTYQLDLLRAVADTADAEPYEALEGWNAGKFVVELSTPLSTYVQWQDRQRRVSKDRRQRAEAAGVQDDISTTDYAPVRAYMTLTGGLTVPVVAVGVDPQSGETSGSFWRTIAIGGQRTLRFKGDIAAVELIREGTVMTPVGGGLEPLVVDVESDGARMSDIANHAHYLFLPEVFAPDSSGVPPSIILRLKDLKNPDERTLYELPASIVARTWNDFGPYYADVHPDRPFTVADPRLFKSRFKDWCRTLGPKC